MRSPRLAALFAVALMATSCSDVPTGSDPTVTARGRIGLAPTFSPSAVAAFQQLAAFGVEVTSVHVRLVAPDGSMRDTSIAFPVGMNELHVELSVPIRTAGQTFRADLELLNSDGVVLFSGSQQVVAQVANGLDDGTPASVQINYTGPGATAKTVTVSAAGPSLPLGGSLAVSAAAQDASGGSISNLLVRWTTSDATIATVTSTGFASANVTSTGKRGAVTVSAITPLGLTGAMALTIIPVPAKILVISGGGQTGIAGSPLAQPFTVELQAADNAALAGVPVTFRASSTGGAVSSVAATTDASGRASTTLMLGPDAGVYQFEATSGTATPATVNATATPAPAARISFLGGNNQTGVVGTNLAQPVTVRVTNAFGAPVGGAVVKWTTAAGGGTPATASSTTAADGTTTTTYKLGTHAQIQFLTASLTGVAAPDGEVNFSFTALADIPATISGSGAGQHAPAGSALASPLGTIIADQYGNPIAGYKVVWAVATGSVGSATMTPSISTTDVGGRASTLVTLGNQPGALVITATAGAMLQNYPETADVSSAPTAPGTLSGFVYDAVTNAGISGASVTVLNGNQTVATVATNGGGNFTTAPLPAGTYSVTITATNYTTVNISTVTLNGNTQAPAAPLVPQSTQSGGISGTVFDATTTRPVSGTVTLELRAGINSTTGTPLQTVTTTQSSYAFANVSAGTYTIVAKAAGYADGTRTGISVGGSARTGQDVILAPVGVAGNVRIVLTWLQLPYDLDSHLTGPGTTGSRFHVFYGSPGNCSSTPFACLDVDDTDGNGPETVTITQQVPGTYRYTVHNYSGSPNIDVSGARVDVYINNALARSFSVPQGSGRYWTVFELDGTTITSINSIGNGPVTSRIPTGGISASRIPSSGVHDDVDVITEARRTHPKRSAAPR
ncbi:MAG: hypothetical protein JWL61_3945 [Gemmatimonadetes bacterium]|nr:hypothetical protein [Gemmatimonadota bacterium]